MLLFLNNELLSSADQTDVKCLKEFWNELEDEYPSVIEKNIVILLPFLTIYRCETDFSFYSYTQTKYRNRLDAISDLRILLSDIITNFKTIASQTAKQFVHLIRNIKTKLFYDLT